MLNWDYTEEDFKRDKIIHRCNINTKNCNKCI